MLLSTITPSPTRNVHLDAMNAKLSSSSLLLTALLCLGLGSVQAQDLSVPSYINYQGSVTDSAGNPLGATDATPPLAAPINRKMIFRIYDSPTDSTNLLWTEEQTVTISLGQFSVLLGRGIQFGSEDHGRIESVFTSNDGGGLEGPQRFLSITVDDGNGKLDEGDVAISPRQQITTTAFAFRAKVAESVDNGAISADMIDVSAVDGSKIATDAVTKSKIAAGAVGKDEIAAGAVDGSKIAANAVTSGKIAANAVGNSDIAANAVDGSKIAANAVTSGKIAANAVGNSDIAANAVTSGKIAANAVGNSDIAANAVTSGKIAANSVNESELGTNTVRGQETLRIVRGTVFSNGTRFYGTGFISAKVSTGRYRIAFIPSFSGIPSATANQLQSATDTDDDDNVIIFDNIDENGFFVTIVDTSNNGADREDESFMFIVVGPVVP
jgi:hypothetical protein